MIPILTALLLFAGGAPPFTVVDLHPPGRITAATFEDLNGDGRVEILLWQAGGLRVEWPDADGGYDPAKSEKLDLPPGARFFGTGQVDSDPRTREVVLVSPAGVLCFAVSSGRLAPTARLLFAADNLIQPGAGDTVHPGAFLRDLDGDGLPDVALATAGGLAIYYQQREGGTPGKWPQKPDQVLPWTPSADLRVDPPGLAGRVGGSVAVPDVWFRDFDGDGRKDLALDDGRTLRVFSAGKDGRFSGLPSDPIDLSPLGEPVPPFVLDDLNGDGRPDYLVALPAEGRVEIHLGDQPLGKPPIRLAVKGWLLPPRILDLDGDGRPDLVVTYTPEFSLPTAVSVTFSKAITIKAAVWLNTGDPKAPYRPAPDAVREIRVKIRLFVDDTGRIRTDHSELTVFAADFDGDGRKDLLLREGTDEVLLYPGQAEGVFAEEPSDPVAIPDTKDCVALVTTVRDLNGDGTPDVAIRYVTRDGAQDRLVLLLAVRAK